jgi:hypothetical protein
MTAFRFRFPASTRRSFTTKLLALLGETTAAGIANGGDSRATEPVVRDAQEAPRCGMSQRSPDRAACIIVRRSWDSQLSGSAPSSSAAL